MKDIRLTNGELINIKVNWLTLKLLNDYGLKKLEEDMKNEEKQLETATFLLYAILRSNGKKVDQEEALMLLPIEDNTVFDIFQEFQERMEALKKKQESKIR